MSSRPLIGLTSAETFTPGFSPIVRHGVNVTYQLAVQRAGGIPVLLPAGDRASVEAQFEHVDGLLICGGPDVSPSFYDQARHVRTDAPEPGIDRYEIQVIRMARRAGIPTLCVCRGMQLLNVALGGTLHQHLAEVTDRSVAHSRSDGVSQPEHEVIVSPSSYLARIVGSGSMTVNSFHHQAVDRVGAGLRIAATAADGVVEALEDPGHPLLLGVQWHPETIAGDARQRALFDALTAAASAVAKQ